ncbi:HrcA family transcriptional regulator [Pseudoalteromonas ruthenica]|uniref:Heat-inducible transcription repressor HrcA n=1 Tax=Pseudoalteromonas ruthenica TaxID=151081 RepID=A0A5S3Z0N5_9GAMM|nr:HrcA family transcriptional regulator [Pseudoalteromonas ruthenica]TMP85621.1 HrcA family transcriptional regulator [Pseudoalteromonas ruthenica]
MKLSPRDEQIFSAVMSLYCDGEGNPVASTRIAKQKGMAVCSATVRNAMSRLEKLGLLYSPHTSAGRIPTEQGFAFWFDSYFDLDQLGLYWQPPQDKLIEFAHHLARRFKVCVCVGLPQVTTQVVFRVEVLDFDRKHWLVLLLDRHGQSHNILITKPVEANDDIRYQFATWLNSVFAQQNLLEGIHRMKAMSRTAPHYCHGSLAQWTRELGNKLGTDNSIVVGENNLYAHSQHDQEYAIGVRFLHAVEDKLAFRNGVSVLIGNSVPMPGFDDFLILSLAYFANHEYQSRFCVIAPKSAEIEAIIQEFAQIEEVDLETT